VKKAKISDLKNRLSSYLDHVRGGGSVLVLDRDQPVARIVPLGRAPDGSSPSTGDERLTRLERRGLIRRGTGGLPDWLGRRRPHRLRGSLLKDLLAERRSGW
jgi:prevent-host-death family protein